MLEFRLSGRLAEHSVPLAFLACPSLSPRKNIATVNLANDIPENTISGRSQSFTAVPDFKIDCDNGCKLALVLSEGIESQDVLVTNRTLIRRDLTRPQPLFFRYEIGRGSHAIYAPPEADVESTEYQEFISYLAGTTRLPSEYNHLLADVSRTIENGIQISIRNAGLANIGWQVDDITPAITDRSSPYYGRAFNAVLYTTHRNSRGLTYMLTYNALDVGKEMLQTGRREVINAKPVAEVVETKVLVNSVKFNQLSVKAVLNDKLAKLLD